MSVSGVAGPRNQKSSVVAGDPRRLMDFLEAVFGPAHERHRTWSAVTD